VTFRGVDPEGGFTRGRSRRCRQKESTSRRLRAAGGDPEAPWADGKHADDDAVRAGGFERAGLRVGTSRLISEPRMGVRVQVPGFRDVRAVIVDDWGGHFSATNLAQSQRWNVGVGTGGFSWSYPLPAALKRRRVRRRLWRLGIRRAASMTAAANSQPSEIGLGWSLTSAFIERSYRICNGWDGWTITDLCWVNETQRSP
jgi:hypothetical protein